MGHQFEKISVRISRVDGSFTDIALPKYATAGASGMDVCAAVAGEKTLAPGETGLIPTGFRLEIPQGYEIQVRPRSGLALKHGVGILNAPGTIDSDYRGELGIILTNFGREPFTVRRGDRIAQIVLTPVVHAEWVEVGSLEDTTRGEGGFGSTGVSTENGKGKMEKKT